jgi:DNA-directed RNA polymerase specialized sigma24 family protein
MMRIRMSKIKEVLRLKYLNLLSNRQIQTITGVSRNSVANSFNEMNLSLEKTLELNDEDI